MKIDGQLLLQNFNFGLDIVMVQNYQMTKRNEYLLQIKYEIQ